VFAGDFGVFGHAFGTVWARLRNGLGTPREDAGPMDSSTARRTRAEHGQRDGRVRLRFHTGTMRTRQDLARQIGIDPSAPGTRLTGTIGPGCPERASSVSGGGTRGGIQRSAPWHWRDKRFSNLADSGWLANGTGPTAHKDQSLSLHLSVQVLVLLLPLLLVVLYCCPAGLDWTVVP
jgi:hypothetical protein